MDWKLYIMIEVKYFSSVWTHIFFSAVTAIEINDQIDQNKEIFHITC